MYLTLKVLNLLLPKKSSLKSFIIVSNHFIVIMYFNNFVVKICTDFFIGIKIYSQLAPKIKNG